MKLRALSFWWAATAAVLALTACGGSGGGSGLWQAMPLVKHRSGSSPIKHIVIIVQENRSFDDFFAMFPGAHGATRGKEKVKRGGKFVDKWVTLKSVPLLQGNDLQHCHSAFETDYDGGKMDGFNREGKGVCPHGQPAGHEPYQYVQKSDIEPYWDIADQWVLADETFQTQSSGSFTAHQDLIRGGTCITSANSCNLTSPDSSTLSLVDNPTNFPWGCDAPSGVTTSTINDKWQVSKGTGPFPCTKAFPDYGSGGYPTLADLLDQAGVKWKYYTPCFSSADQKNCSPSSDCDVNAGCAGGTLDAFDVIWSVRNSSAWGKKVVWPETKILNDVTNNTLPPVSWVIPNDADSDHPGEKCGCDDGPSWVASVVNAVGESSYWKSSVIVVLWDDWGGFYDNVPPPIHDGWGGLGFRVPMMILSPYAIAGSGSGGYISHTQYEFGSILKFIENNWSLGSLGTTDTRANSIDDVFNYSQTPRKFNSISSKHDARYFLSEPQLPQHGDPQ